MNKRLMFTKACLILGSLMLADSVLAQPNPNYQSVKQCPQSVIAAAHVTLTDNFPNFRRYQNFYQVCNANFTLCQDRMPAARRSGLIIIGSNGPNIIQGTPFNDSICGMNGNDIINGRGGNDILYGNNGSDELSGGLGNDVIYGGNGNDILFGYDEGFDALFTVKTHDDLLDTDLASELRIPYPFPFHVDSDTLWGGNGFDQLYGGPDSDALAGENGRDHLDGGDGVDAIDGGNGVDSCTDINDACASGTNL